MSTTKRKVAIVDDSEPLLTSVGALLEDVGYDVLALRNAIGCSAALSSFVPDVILMDIQMPNLSGEALVRILRGMRALRHSRIVLHSGLDSTALSIAAERCGADAYLRKGSPVNILMMTVETLAAQAEGARGA